MRAGEGGASTDEGAATAGRERQAPHLPDAVRARVLALAADELGALPAEEVPATLRPFARFTPSRRARLAAVPLGAALDTDPMFRQRVAARVRTALPDVAAAVEAGTLLPATPPADVAALAYLLRPPGWIGYVEQAAADLEQATARVQADEREALVGALRAQVGAERETARAETERLRGEIAVMREEADDLRRRLREALEQARRAERAAAQGIEDAVQARASEAAATSVAEAEARRARGRLAEATATLESVRRTAREGRGADELRLRVLLDTLLGAARGLRRELGLPPVQDRPADAFSAEQDVVAPLGAVSSRGLTEDSPALLDALLGAPKVHLVVDGYNVTKGAYGTLPLEAQRLRLLAGLATLAAQTHAEITCVFDGAERPTALAAPSPRGVRLLFSAGGETADELIRRLVRAEPPGRPVVVVSSDREVADGVRRAGARPLPSIALARRLG